MATIGHRAFTIEQKSYRESTKQVMLLGQSDRLLSEGVTQDEIDRSHTWSHPDIATLSPAKLESELTKVRQLLPTHNAKLILCRSKRR